MKLTSFSLLAYFVATKSQFSRNTDIGRTALWGGDVLWIQKKTATYSHQLHGKGKGQVLHLKEEGHRFEGEVILKIFDNQYGVSLTSLNSDTN